LIKARGIVDADQLADETVDLRSIPHVNAESLSPFSS
jgi:hypothetical protein